MDYLIFFLLIIGASFILPELAKKIHIPYVTSIIITGVLIGPFGFNILDLGDTASFLAFIGAIFLMFTAGLDVRISSLRRIGKKSLIIALTNGVLPFIVGYFVASYFGYNLITSLILGAIFVSSSIAIVIPSLKETKLADTDLGRTIISSTVFEDVTSLLILAFLLQSVDTSQVIPLSMYIPLVIVSLLLLFFFLPKLQAFFVKQRKETQKGHVFEGELRFIVTVLIVTALFFELLGLHAIIAGFFVGLFLSDAIGHRLVSEKLYTISYGIFIPIFFLVIGMRTDVLSLFTVQEHLLLTGAIVGALIFSKFCSGWLGGMLTGHNNRQSLLIGSATIPQLSTTLVVALVALEANLFDETLVTSIIVLSIVTTLISPFLIKLFHKRLENNNNLPAKLDKKIRGVKKETTQLKSKVKRVKKKERKIQEIKEKAKEERKKILKHKKEITKIKKVIRKKKK